MDGEVLANTLLSVDKLLMLRQCAENVRRQNLSGATAELGVYRGGASKLIINELPDRKHYAFDSFTGLSNVQDDVDWHKNGDFADVNYADACALLNSPNVEIRKGFFPDTAHDLADAQFSLVHMDADTYQSTRDGLAFFYPRLVPGGFIVIDDYTYHNCPGVEKACTEFFADKPEKVRMLVNGQGVISKEPTASTCLQLWFDHGLGDVVHFCQVLQLYRARNYLISVHFEGNKEIVWRASGFPYTELHGSSYHPFVYMSDFNWPAADVDHSGNKTASNIGVDPLPLLADSLSSLWDELDRVDERARIRAYIGAQSENVDQLLAGLPGPVILLHSNGSNWSGSKNIPPDVVSALYKELLDNSDASLVLLDWDSRVPPPPPSCRVRHVRRDTAALSTKDMFVLFERAKLLIGVDSGPLHSALLAGMPVLGVFHHFYPSCITLPNARAAFMTRNADSYRPVNQARRGRWSILEYGGNSPSAKDIARHALRMLAGPRYLSKERAGRDLMLQQFVRDWLDLSPPGIERADRNLTFDWLLRETSARFKAPNIVETGCQRSNEDWSAGCSTYLFGCYLDGLGAGHLSSVDISQGNLAVARQCCQPWSSCISYHASDSVKWLKEYRQVIDVLYLDSLDADNPETAAHGLREFQAALPKLHARSIVCIDDTVWGGDIGQANSGSYHGKAGDIVAFALANGWRVAVCGYQVVLTRSPQEHRA